jgi:hypothetical protein
MSACSFCNGKNRTLIGLLDGRWICWEECVSKITAASELFKSERVEALIKLCHPDRHRGPNEQLATETTQWLLSLRKRRTSKHI